MRISDWSSDVCSSDLGVNSGDNARVIRQANDRERLTPIERAQIIDAQAVHLLGTVERLRGNAEAAKTAQLKGLGDALAVRQGRVTSIVRLRSQMLGELALAEAAVGDTGSADARFPQSRSEEHTSELQSLMRTSY